ncbi:MAG: peptidase M48 Ste24p [Candidatus Electrothrix sp. AR5]|nr:peptidase M48 Ste24p [Candidatus Electrothrix sp. AR5]
MFQLKIHPRETALFFLAFVILLTVLHSIAQAVLFSTGNQELTYITGYVDLDIEKNIPSFYSGFALFFSSLLFFCLSSLDKKQGKKCRYWLGLAGVFFFLSLDETFVLHERLGDYTEKYIKSTGILEASGLLYFPWIIPYSILMTILGLLYFRFIFRLPRKTTILLILSAILFLTGAAGFDMLGGREAELHGYYTITYTVLYTIEEFLEMIGVVLLIYTLLDYIEQRFGHLCFSLEMQES